jgi:hypothetical protein
MNVGDWLFFGLVLTALYLFVWAFIYGGTSLAGEEEDWK